MSKKSTKLEDIAKMAASAANVTASFLVKAGRQACTKIEKISKNRISREEFDAAKAMAAKAREEQELLKEKLNKLEKQLEKKGKKPVAKVKKTTPKPAVKKATPKKKKTVKKAVTKTAAKK